MNRLFPASIEPAEVPADELRRLLGYPVGVEVSGRVSRLAQEARSWFEAQAHPWTRGTRLEIEGLQSPEIFLEGGVRLRSETLANQLSQAGAHAVCIVAVSAGGEVSREVEQRWAADRLDESFVLDAYASGVVEELVRRTAVRLCDWAEPKGEVVLPHYSPGYEGWELDDQKTLLEVVSRADGALPGPLRALSSGMLEPTKSLLGLFGLTRDASVVTRAPDLCPCTRCSLDSCQYRRAPYAKETRSGPRTQATVSGSRGAGSRVSGSRAAGSRPDGAPVPGTPGAHRFETVASSASTSTGPETPSAQEVPAASEIPAVAEASNRRTEAPTDVYAFPAKALGRWTKEYLQLDTAADGTIVASFRYNGNTCGNMGRPLKLDFTVRLSPGPVGLVIESCGCEPTIEGSSYQAMCASIQEGDGFLRTIRAERPLLGCLLEQVLEWNPVTTPSGCLCGREDRDHKWRIVLQTIHYAIAKGLTGEG